VISPDVSVAAREDILPLFDRLVPVDPEDDYYLQPLLTGRVRQVLAFLVDHQGEFYRYRDLDRQALAKDDPAIEADQEKRFGNLRAIFMKIRRVLEQHCPDWEIVSLSDQTSSFSLRRKTDQIAIFSLSLVSGADFPLLPKKIREQVIEAVNRVRISGHEFVSRFSDPMPLLLFRFLADHYGQLCPLADISRFLNNLPPEECPGPVFLDQGRIRTAASRLRRAISRIGAGLQVYCVGKGEPDLGYILMEKPAEEVKQVTLSLPFPPENDFANEAVYREVWPVCCRVKVNGTRLVPVLGPVDRGLLLYLAGNQDRYCSCQDLARIIWGDGSLSLDKEAIRVRVCRLRKALQGTPYRIESALEIGYRLVRNSDCLPENQLATLDGERG